MWRAARAGARDRDAVGEHDALVAERQRDGAAPEAGAPERPQRRPGAPAALGEAGEPVPQRERAHERDVLGDDEPARRRAARAACRRGSRQRVGGHVAPPALAGEPGGHRRGVRRDHAQRAAVGEQRRARASARRRGRRGARPRRRARSRRSALPVAAAVLERGLVDLEPEHVARVAGGRAGELEPGHLVAAPARLVEQQAVAAADVEQAPARRVARRSGRAAAARSRGGPPPRAGTRRRASRGRGRAARRRTGRPGCCTAPQSRAREQVAVLARPVVAGREVGRLAGPAPATVAELEWAVADPAGAVRGPSRRAAYSSRSGH